MIHRLPGWVWSGAFLLAGIAGMVNAVGLLGVYHHGLTHVTGTASALGVALEEGQWAVAGRFALLLVTFVAGAVVSGGLIGEASLHLGRRYGVALVLESLLLAGAAVLLTRGEDRGVYLVSAAAGLQNAMASTFSGAIVRTTHLTGIFTDVGIALGQAIRRHAIEWRKITLLATIAAGFIVGSAAGAWQYSHFGDATLWTPTVLTAAGGLSYIAIHHVRRRRGSA